MRKALRRKLSLLLTLLLLFNLLSISGPVLGEETAANDLRTLETVGDMSTTPEDFFYNESNGEAIITGYSSDGPKDVVIPSELGGYPVTSIGDWAFIYNQLTSVTIPDSVTSIGEFAFSNNHLTEVTIPDSVTSIGEHAFMGNLLTEVTIGNSVTSIGNFAFSNNQLTSLTIPDSVTIIGIAAFLGMDYQNITLGSGFETYYIISGNTLEGHIASPPVLHIPSEINGVTITSIGEGAFMGNQLTGVTIPDSVTTIGHGAFDSNQLTEVTIPGSVTTIGASAFNHNQLTEVTIPDSVTSIDQDTFNDNQLTQVTIGNNVTSIGTTAFSNNLITEVTIPDSVNIINQSAFSRNRLTAVTIPNSVTSIGRYAFHSNQLTEVTIPGSVTSIDLDAFRDNQLTEVTIKSKNITIGYGVFSVNQSNPSDLTIYGIEGSNSEIYATNNNHTFVAILDNPSATAVNITGDEIVGATLTGNYTFVPITAGDAEGTSTFRWLRADEADKTYEEIAGAAGLTYELQAADEGKFIKFEVTPVDNLGNTGEPALSAPTDAIQMESVELTEGDLTYSISGGEATVTGYDYYWDRTIPDNTAEGDYPVTAIAAEVFSNIPISLDQFSLGENIRTIGEAAFKYVIWYGAEPRVLTIPDNVENIGDSAFKYNIELHDSALQNISIGNGVTTIGDKAFKNHSNLTSLTLGENVETIGAEAFMDGDLRTVIIPDNVTEIGARAFAGNPLDLEIIIGSSVETIGEAAFKGIGQMIPLTIPESVTSIGEEAFQGNVGEVIFEGTGIIEIGDNAFRADANALRKAYNTSGLGMYVYVWESGEWQHSVEEFDYERINDTNKARIIGYTWGGSRHLEIPDTVVIEGDTLNITEIESGIFTRDLSGFGSLHIIETVKLPVHLEVIRDGDWESGAFQYQSLTTVEIPDNVKRIGDYAFANNWHLTSLTLSDGLLEIGEGAFSDHSLTDITIPASVTIIDDYAFVVGVGDVERIVMKSSDTNIGESFVAGNNHFRDAYTDPETGGAGTYLWVDDGEYGDWVKQEEAVENPSATDVSITGDAIVGATLTGNYTFVPNTARNEEGASNFRWLQADEADGTYTEIAGAAALTYELQAADESKYIKFEVTVRDVEGNVGVPVQSAPAGPVAAAATVSIESVEPVTVSVPFGTILEDAKAALGAEVEVLLAEDGDTAQVPVTWDEDDLYDGFTPGDYSFYGTFGELPPGVDNDGDVAAPAGTVTVEALPKHTVTFAVYAGEGTLTAEADGSPITSGDLITAGEEITFTAAPDPDSRIKDWFKNGIALGITDTVYTIQNLQDAVEISVEFELEPAQPIDECFIATAAFGSKLDPGVALLRQFRDAKLLTNRPGQAFVDFYYKYSPAIAGVIGESEALKSMVRVLLLPLIGLAWTLINGEIVPLFMLVLTLAAVFIKRKRKHMAA